MIGTRPKIAGSLLSMMVFEFFRNLAAFTLAIMTCDGVTLPKMTLLKPMANRKFFFNASFTLKGTAV